MKLVEYQKKRDFKRTPEPRGKQRQPAQGWRFVIQKHAATRLHYDFRLELEGVLKSWAVPKGPSLDPADKRLAVHVEDHPIEYGGFEGVIPKGEYGGGEVIIWDRGTWTPIGDARKDYQRGRLKFELHGEKLRGIWNLVRTTRRGAQDQWLLIKHRDDDADPGAKKSIVDKLPLSVASGRSIEDIERGGEHERQWTREGEKPGKKKPRSKKTRARSAGSSSRNSGADAADVVIAPRQPASGAAEDHLTPAKAPGARKASLPQTVRPQLATLRTAPPTGDQWIHEIKFDGYRLLAIIGGGQVRLMTRSGLDWTHRFGAIAKTLAGLGDQRCVIDGEAVVLDRDGRSNFQMLQNHLGDSRGRIGSAPKSNGSARASGGGQLAFYAFDLVHLNGYDLTQCPLLTRKQLLRDVLEAGGLTGRDNVHYTDHIVGHGADFLDQACAMGLEGIISKQADSPYRAARTHYWLKSKCNKRQEFVIVGYTDPAGSREAFGSLLLGYYDREDASAGLGTLRYCGRVGTGFSDKTLRDLLKQLRPLGRDAPAVADAPPSMRRKAHWVEPRLVAEVEFTGWTDDNRLRHPAFHGLREDKPPEAITREVAEAAQPASGSNDAQRGNRKAASVTSKTVQPKGSARPGRSQGRPEVGGVAISHPDRVLYAPDITKLDLAQFYEEIADHILPHIVNRPLAIVRCPQGQSGKCFFQKNVTESLPDAIDGIAVTESDGPATYIAVNNKTGLISLVHMGVLEMHPWGSRGDKLEQPDRLIMDLDPAPDLPFSAVAEAAVHVRDELAKLDLVSFLKTTGGKGLHVVVPLARRAGWEDVKEFAHALADHMVRLAPTRYIANMSKSKRTGRIFIDYLRNGRGATAIAAFSTRARPGAPVSTPIRWDELTPTMRGDSFNVRNLRQRLAKLKKDPWADLDDHRQSITQARRSALK